MNFFIEYFSHKHIWLPFAFTEVRILLSLCKLNNSARMRKSC